MPPLAPRTPAGQDLLALADRLAPVLEEHAAAHDRSGAFARPSLVALRDAGYLLAPVPAALGGLGVDSLHDLVVAAVRLARADASVVIGVNMHLLAVLGLRRVWNVAVAAGDQARADGAGAALRALADERTVLAAAVSEHGQDLTRPRTAAVRRPGGWRVDGAKAFCTMAPAATTFYTAVRYADAEGRDRYGYAFIPAGAAGVTVHDDWDALGMRGSGSSSVTFDGVEIDAEALRGGFLLGDATGYMARNLPAALLHAAAALGVAEAAHDHALALARRREAGDGRAVMLAAANATDLAAARATLAAAATDVDDRHAARPARALPDDEVVAAFTATQAAKVVTGEAAARVVERALELSGGAGYRAASPLARAYRDVRATMFMHPLGASRAHDFLGQAALGLPPRLG